MVHAHKISSFSMPQLREPDIQTYLAVYKRDTEDGQEQSEHVHSSVRVLLLSNNKLEITSTWKAREICSRAAVSG